MPPREPSAFVWDVLDACRTIGWGLSGIDKQAYLADEIRRLAIERLLINIGEAMTRLRDSDLSIARELGDVDAIVGFRNVLVHGYFALDHDRVWQILSTDLGPLRTATEKVWPRFAPLYPE
jgi:uncharacterized protein with HEPN domain